jgi:hypothetical protein
MIHMDVSYQRFPPSHLRLKYYRMAIHFFNLRVWAEGHATLYLYNASHRPSAEGVGKFGIHALGKGDKLTTLFGPKASEKFGSWVREGWEIWHSSRRRPFLFHYILINMVGKCAKFATLQTEGHEIVCFHWFGKVRKFATPRVDGLRKFWFHGSGQGEEFASLRAQCLKKLSTIGKN